jgi:alpha-galactosidase
MKRFTHESASSGKHLPVLLQLSDAPVYFIGPATQDNPMSQVRTKLIGKVIFQDRKIKWNRVTLQFLGKAGIDIDAPRSVLPRDHSLGDLDDPADATTKIQTTVPICEVEKELIFSGEESIEFGLHLPSHLPSSSRTKHAFVEYTLVANFSAGTFFKKYRTQKVVKVHRHYLPSPSAMIPTMDYSGVKEWFEWSVELPKATAIESGEVVVAFRCSVEKERVEVDRIQLAIEEIESYKQVLISFFFHEITSDTFFV